MQIMIFNQIKKLNSLVTRRQRKLLIILTFFLFVGMIFEVFGLGILLPAISLILKPEIATENETIKQIMPFLGDISHKEFVFLFLGFVVLVYLVRTFFLVFLTYKQNRFLANLSTFFSKMLYQKYLLQPYSFHLSRNSSSLVKNIQTEISYVNSFCTSLMSFFC